MQPLSWQKQLSRAIRCPNELLEYAGLRADSIGYCRHAIKRFPLLVPHAFAARITPGDPDDPILRQVFPYTDEDRKMTGYVKDPLRETGFQPLPGLLRKYKSRALAVTTGACAIHCRYCFRRHYPYYESSALRKYWNESIDYIGRDESINEIILSGGDPLTLSDGRLLEMLGSLSTIKHIKRIRIHTRMPVALPDRITFELLEALTGHSGTIICVIHVNHANELDDHVAEKINLLIKNNILVLNQSVLLKGVNDSVESLIDLSDKLIRCNVVPYYLHLLDPVAGAGHYAVDKTAAVKLIGEMQHSTSGYLVPRLVREETGKPGKTLMFA